MSEPDTGFPQDCSPRGEGRFAAQGAGSCTDCGINEDTAGSQTASECCETFSNIYFKKIGSRAFLCNCTPTLLVALGHFVFIERSKPKSLNYILRYVNKS